MKVKLLRQNRIDGRTGEIVEVSPARAAFLLDLKLAVPAEGRELTKPEKEATEKKAATRATKGKK